MSNSILDTVRTNRDVWREQRDSIERQIGELLDAAETRGDARLSASEQRRCNDLQRQRDDLSAQIDEASARIEQLLERDQRLGEAAEERRRLGLTAVVNEPNPVYRRDDPNSASFFRDLAVAAQPGAGHDPQVMEARDRLRSSQLTPGYETRAGDMTTVAGTGGEFGPPLWLVSDFVVLARPGRVAADVCNRMDLPQGVSTINLPKVASGTSVTVQQTQNSAVSDTAMTTTSVSSGITTLAGKQVVALQLFDQTPNQMIDRVVLQDLAASYAVQLDGQVLYGSGVSGQVSGLVNTTNVTAFTTTQPAPASTTVSNSLYYAISKAASAMHTTLFKAPDAIIMSPRRWDWILGSVDVNSRPLVTVNTPSFNALGSSVAGPIPAEGASGTFGSFTVYVDPNISTTANSTTDQDEIYLVRREELWLWETQLSARSFDATYADQLSILLRCHGYLSFIADRYPAAVQVVRGTGLVSP